MVQSHLDHTKKTFEDVQNIKDKIIANGETHEEAKKAYLDKIPIYREMLKRFVQEQIKNAEYSFKTNQQYSENQ